MTVKVSDSPLSAKKQKIADHISDSEEESDIEEYDTEGEISENSCISHTVQHMLHDIHI